MDYSGGSTAMGTALAATGGALATGSWILLGVGIISAGITLFLLFRRPGVDRP